MDGSTTISPIKSNSRQTPNISALGDSTDKGKNNVPTKQVEVDNITKEVENLTFSNKNDDTQGRSADGGTMFSTSNEIDAQYPNWLDGTTTESGKHSTQVEGTRKTYNKVGSWIEENLGKDVEILDASSGMGYGTADLRERGFNIEDVEPYQSAERKANNPATYSSYADIDKKYDYIISNAVLNVIPDDWRANVLHDMADRLKDGGQMFINTRKAGEEKSIKDKIELDFPQEVLVKRNGRIASYQRFFTPQELREWVQQELGDGYKVEIANKANSGTSGLAAVVVTKKDPTKSRVLSPKSERGGAVPGNPSSNELQQVSSEHLSHSALATPEGVAKLQKNTQNTLSSAKKNINSGGLSGIDTVENAVRKVANVLKLEKSRSSHSYYGELYEGEFGVNGKTLKLRLSTHPANGVNIWNAETDDKISIVLYKNGEHTSRAYGKTNVKHNGYTEYTYNQNDISLDDASNAIISSVVNLLKTGEYVDKTEKAIRKDYPHVTENGEMLFSIFNRNQVGFVSNAMKAIEMKESVDKQTMFSTKRKAPETASVQDEHQPTVVSSADGAKLLKDLDSAITEYENKSGQSKTFLGDIAQVLGATKHGSNSQYATFEAVNGKVFTIRLANHNAKVSNFDNHGENEGISIVVTAQDNNGVDNDGNAHVVEFFYDAIKLRKADGKPLVEILKSIKQSLYSGVYKDPCK